MGERGGSKESVVTNDVSHNHTRMHKLRHIQGPLK